MERKSFFKTLFIALVSPKILSEIDFTKAVTGESAGVALSSESNMALISQLQLLTPDYYKHYIQKYGNEDFTWWLANYANTDFQPNQFWHENRPKIKS